MRLTFKVDFHGPFIVSTGSASDSLDHTVDEEEPFPSSELKGLLRAHAKTWLGIPERVVGEIFGTATANGAWIFSSVSVQKMQQIDDLAPGLDPSIWNRVTVDSDGRAQERALVSGRQVWASEGEFAATWDGAGEVPTAHMLVIRAAARDIVSVGMNRRRGFGWVTVTDLEPWSEADSLALHDIRMTNG
ncbi:hypothetical protein SAMN02745244_02881 [Tessaracoccus bendigoensis DSM 12906]|uniref:CRISPR type III-associated protein domain-containing protein n=1 Tax=Tessaracoccus bendigoensis DSM 12906 TaxID=1123357 RepID=A0A1M6KQ53_9ACTN|nr:RAMP superfamily CRISPR-associated protein [Tessaracoccus bendigoensis]SHJ61035.1 hypothetical protein SAMN02745244_02881 [Tessaracoccus bendigoensis DSM 12906]